MPDIFDHIASKAHQIFEGVRVCVHVGDVDQCDIKRHPTYPRFRAEAISAGIQSAQSSRVWESLITMGRLCDLNGGTTWRLVILDCIVPCFRSISAKIAREFRVELEEIRSAMTTAALEVWSDSAKGVNPRQVRDRIVKASFEVAFRYANAGSSEYSTDEIEFYIQTETSSANSTLNTESIIDVNKIRDTDVAEQIRGERFGALLQGLGHSDSIRIFHDDLRSGRRSGSVGPTVRSGLPRFRISDPNLYYYTSDLYLPFIGLQEAANVMGISEHAAHRLIRAGEFPFPVARAGRSYKASVRALMHFKEIPDSIVHADDVENGALHARLSEN